MKIWNIIIIFLFVSRLNVQTSRTGTTRSENYTPVYALGTGQIIYWISPSTPVEVSCCFHGLNSSLYEPVSSTTDNYWYWAASYGGVIWYYNWYSNTDEPGLCPWG